MLRPLVVSLFASVIAAQGWVDRTPANPFASPSARAFPAMCWDAAHGYVLMVGGYGTGTGFATGTWTWNGTAWTQRTVSTVPSGFANATNPADMAMAFHAPTNEPVLWAGGTTWTWSGTDWLVRGGLPTTTPANCGAPGNVAMGHDPTRNQTVLFVGSRFGSTNRCNYSETFVWDGFGWTARTTPNLPWPVDYPSMAFDPVTNKLLLNTNGGGQSAWFEWNGTNWQQRFLAGAPSAAGAMCTDATNQRLVMLDAVMNGTPNHTWSVGNGTVQQLSTPVEPGRRFGAAMAYDPIRQRVVMFGGTPAWSQSTQTYLALGDTWEFQLGAGASYTAFGAGCVGSRGVPTLAASFGGTPRVGQTFQATVTNLPLQGLTVMFLGLSNTTYGAIPLPFGLAPLGAPGCSVLSAGDDLGLVTNVLGTGFWQWTVPNAPGFSFYNQAFVFDGAANALGITTSNGAHGVIGF